MTLTDVTLSVALSIDSETLEGAFPAMERGIRDPKAPWRDITIGERANRIKSQDSKNRADWEK